MQGHGIGRLAPEDVLGEADLGAGEPGCPWHRLVSEYAGSGHFEAHVEELDDRGPEPLQVIDRPLPQLLVVLKSQTALAREPLLIAHDPGALDLFG